MIRGRKQRVGMGEGGGACVPGESGGVSVRGGQLDPAHPEFSGRLGSERRNWGGRDKKGT